MGIKHSIQGAYTTVNGRAIIPTRKNSSTLSRGSPYRARIKREIRRTS